MEDFSNAFVTEEVVNAGEEDFDPFNIGVASATNANGKSVGVDDSKSVVSAKSSASTLPPRVMVKFKIEEEVSSTTHLSDESEGSSDVQIEGTVIVSFMKAANQIVPMKLMTRKGYRFFLTLFLLFRHSS